MSTLEQLYWLFIFATGFIAMTNPTRGIFLTVAIGFIQEPVRKVMPNQPIYIIASLLVPFVGALWGSFASSAVHITRNFFRLYPQLLLPTQFSLALIIYQIVNAYLFSGSVAIIFIGVINYIMPLFALLVAFQFSSSKRNAMRLIYIYIIGATILASGSVLTLYGYDSILTESVGADLYIYDEMGRKALKSGFFRAPEIAGHHCAIAIILIIILIVSRPVLHRPDIILLLLIAVAILTIGLTLAGRRKTIVQIGLFLILYLPILRATMRVKTQIDLPTVLFTIGLAAIGWWVITGLSTNEAFNEIASARLIEVEEEELSRRAASFLIAAPIKALEVMGVLGAGAGILSQGISAIWTEEMLLSKGLLSTAQLWFAESGLGRLAGEFGVLGLLIILLSFSALYRVYFRSSKYINQNLVSEYPLFLGLSIVLGIIQPLNFFMAAPAYSDPFVVISLALFAGLTLAIPTWENEN